MIVLAMLDMSIVKARMNTVASLSSVELLVQVMLSNLIARPIVEGPTRIVKNRNIHPVTYLKSIKDSFLAWSS